MDESNLNLEKSRMIDSEGNIEPESFFKKNKSYLEAFKEEINYGEKYEKSETSQILQSIIDEQEEKEKEKEKAFNDFKKYFPRLSFNDSDSIFDFTNDTKDIKGIKDSNFLSKEFNCESLQSNKIKKYIKNNTNTLIDLSSIKNISSSMISTNEKKFIEAFLNKKRRKKKLNNNNSYEISQSKVFKTK